MTTPRIALLSNPCSTGNRASLPRIRDYCAGQADIFHYEVDEAEQIGEAVRTIAQVKPAMLVINGGDGTVQAVLTELHNVDHFDGATPPVAVLPSGKTNLIALDLGAQGDPIAMLQKLQAVVRGGIEPHIVARELIALRQGQDDQNPVIGMFLGGAGLADVMLYCRNRIYPLGLPNGVSHFLTAIAVVMQQLFGLKGKSLPPEPREMTLSLGQRAPMLGRFSLLMVTTLDKLLLNQEMASEGQGGLKLIVVEQRRWALLRAMGASIMGKLGRSKVEGVHIEQTDAVSIEGDDSQVILDGEMFSAKIGRPILLQPARPLSFVRLAA
ncbi:diacylglycerol/lipid kinase family protein [Sphingomicrobium nitratireducens]|uniref:diacylglycerol/lipid kinase family protein n=1 Tax=Sphingomicrobium nitratireducens TaxID=2964666 RepID=UPI0022408824|nr:diacylglycerol kinase family protein [Sphingomicrobium nitratireducens]